MDASSPRYRTTLGAVSLIVGPALMSVGDLFHPAESWDTAAQVAIIATTASRWYGAHLLLFVGMLLFVPGILALTKVVANRKPAAGYAARVLFLISVGALSAVFVFEMLLGAFISQSADPAAGVALLQTFMSKVFLAIQPGLLAFFIATGIASWTLAAGAGPYRWPALLFALGAILILGEIILAEVVLSQIGNIVIFVAGAGFARALLRDREDSLNAL